MAFSFPNLTSFKLEDSGILVSKAVLGTDLSNYIDVRPGYPEATVSINILDTVPQFENAACGWVSGGTVSFTQINVTNATKAWKQSLCLEDLRQYWLSTQLQASAYGTDLPFETAISDNIVLQTKKYAETLIGTSIIAQTGTASACVQGTSSVPTSSNCYTIVQSLIDDLPLNVQSREDLTVFMSYANFRKLQVSMIALNLFHYNTGETTGTGLGQFVIIPGTNVRAIPVGGWGTSNRILVGPAKHIIMTCGLLDDTDRIEAWWSQDNQEMRMLSKFTMGVGVLAEEFVTNTLA